MNTKTMTRLAVLIALSVIGAFIKIPSVVGSLAFDAVPGFYAALTINPATGAIVAGLGHAATAVVSGMPLGVQIHALVAMGMMLAAYVAGVVAKHNSTAGCVVGIIINGIVLPAMFIVMPDFGLAFFIATSPTILMAATLNVAVAVGLSRVSALRKLLHVT